MAGVLGGRLEGLLGEALAFTELVGVVLSEVEVAGGEIARSSVGGADWGAVLDGCVSNLDETVDEFGPRLVEVVGAYREHLGAVVGVGEAWGGAEVLGRAGW